MTHRLAQAFVPLLAVAAVLTAGASTTPGAPAASAASAFPLEALLFTRSDGTGAMYAVNADGSGLKAVPGGRRSPDGRFRAIVRCLTNCEADGGPSVSGLFVGDAAGRQLRRLATSPWIGGYSWSPDSTRVAVGLGIVDPSVAIFDRRTGVMVATITDADAPQWSPTGRRLLLRRHLDLYTVRPNGRDPHRVAHAFNGSWSADGKRIVYEQDNVLYTVTFNGADPRRLFAATGVDGATSSASLGSTPKWSPRGNRIAFTAAPRENDWGVYLIRADGREPRRVVALGAYNTHVNQELVWSPDGRLLAATAIEHSYSSSVVISDVFVVDAGTGAAARITQGWRYGYQNTQVEWHPRRLPTSRIPGTRASWPLPSDTLSGPTELKTTRVVERLAADGLRTAYTFVPPTYASYTGREIYRSSPLNCGESWVPAKSAVTRLRVPCSGMPWGPQGIAVAGDRLAWIESILGPIAGSNTFNVYSAATDPAPTLAFGGSGIPAGDLIGDGGVFVFDTWDRTPSWCVGSGCNGGPKSGGALYLLRGDTATRIAAGEAGVSPLSVDRGRILVDRAEGRLDILAEAGGLIRAFRLNAQLVRGARLQGPDLVVLTPTAVEVSDADFGAFLRRWPAPAGARLADVQDGIAALIAGTDIHLIDLLDGHDTIVHVAGEEPILAQLEPGALFYAYKTSDEHYPGRVR